MAQIVGNPVPDNNGNINLALQIEPQIIINESENGNPVCQCTEINMETLNVVYATQPVRVVEFERLQNLEAVGEEPVTDNNGNINRALQIESQIIINESENANPVCQCTEINMEPLNVVYPRQPLHVLDLERLRNLEAVVEKVGDPL